MPGIKMMKVDPIARISGMAAKYATNQTTLRKLKKLGLSKPEHERKANQDDQRSKVREPASAEARR